MTPIHELVRPYDPSEIIADGIVHGVGVAAALVAVTVLIFYATAWGSAGAIAASWIYGVGLVAALGISFAYNIWPRSPVKWVLRRLDHSAIFILIAATYTPFLQRGAHDPWIFAMLLAIWATAIFGITLKCLFPGRFDKLTILLYLAMGWSGAMIYTRLYDVLSLATLLLILVGGVIYTAGVVFHLWEKLRFQNAIWHGFVVAAAGVHYAAVLTCVIGLAAPNGS